MAIPHRNNPLAVPTRRPCNDHETLVQITGGYKSFLAIVAPAIATRVLIAQKDLLGVGEIEAAFLERLAALRFVPGQRNLCIYEK
jgi:hypothetical protein